MTIADALAQRLPRIRKAIWAQPTAYLRLPLMPDGQVYPWAELYDEFTQHDVLHVRPGSQRLCVLERLIRADDGYERYQGPISPWEQHPDNDARLYAED